MGLSHSPKIATDGLVFCVDAANNRSYPGAGTAWTDLVGENNGTLDNGPTFSSANGGNIVFDGSDDEIVCGDGDFIEGLTEITACCWAIVENSGNSYPKLISKSHAQSFDFGVTRDGANGNLWLYLEGNLLQLVGSITFGEWFYAVARYKSGETNGKQLWLNGNKIAEETQTATIDTSATGLTLGNGNSQARPLTGQIASASIYNRALSASEIVQNYNATRGRFA